MANDLTANPLILNTAHASDVVLGARRRIQGIKWVGASTAGHQAVLKGKVSTRVIWESIATAANFSIPLDVLDLFVAEEVILPTLGSGILYLYLES